MSPLGLAGRVIRATERNNPENGAKSTPRFCTSRISEVNCIVETQMNPKQFPRPVQQGPVTTPPPKRRRRYRFRWAWVLVPLTLMFLAWLATGVKVAVRFDDIMRALSVRNTLRYRQLATMGLLAIGLVAILKVLSRSK